MRHQIQTVEAEPAIPGDSLFSSAHQPSPIRAAGPARGLTPKWSFVTRLADPSMVDTLVTDIAPHAGDLVRARVHRIAQHTKLQLTTGRRSQLYVGDEIVLAYGNRYAPDQFEAIVPEDLRPCQLVAAGGIAAQMLSKHTSLKNPTLLEPIGLLADRGGRVLNLRDFKRTSRKARASATATCIGVVGTSMNSGKTTTAAHIIHGLARAGSRVAAIKVTGTGAGNDVWAYEDAGACVAYDFTDAGFASTYKASRIEIEQCFVDLVALASEQAVDAIVVEVADGLLHAETADLIESEAFQSTVSRIVFAAGEAMAAQSGVAWLERRGLEVVGISGAISASELACLEASRATGHYVFTKEELIQEHVARLLTA